MAITPATRGRNPFDNSGVRRGADGIARYAERPASLVGLLRAGLERDPEAIALVEVGGPSLSYAELWRGSARVAGGLRAAGIARGDRVAIRLVNGIDWVLAFFGAQFAGAVAVPVNTRFSEEEAAYVIGDSEAGFTFLPGAALPDGEELVEEDLKPQDLAAIFYTSGTAGFPKGAMLTHENFTSNSESSIRALKIDRAEGSDLVTLVAVPLFHVTGCNSQLIPVLELGGRVEMLASPLDVDGFFTAVGEHGVNLLVSVPAIYYALVNLPRFKELDVSGVRWLLYGGAPIAESLVRTLAAAFPQASLGNGFGLTETASMSTFLPDEETAEHADSVGFAMPVCDMAIDQPDSESGVGELLLRGPNVVAGYWRKPAESEEAFSEGWLHTGDLARIDEDGLLYVVDRKKDMINRGGENVYSLEVENVLAGAPGVGEVAVLPVPDAMMGEKVGAVIVPAFGAEVDPDAVIDYCKGRLADFKRPQYLALRSEPLPRNANGKVLKRRLREQVDWGDALR